EPQQLLSYLQQNKQLPKMFAEVRRSLTVAAVVEAATVTDTDGNVIDTSEFFGRRTTPKASEADDAEAAAEAEEADNSGDEANAADQADAGGEGGAEAAAVTPSEESSGDTK